MSRFDFIKRYLLTHSLHLGFVTAALALLNASEFIRKKIGVLYDQFAECVRIEDLCYKIISKSDLSSLKAEQDHLRDIIVSCIKRLIKTFLLHYNLNMSAAARRLKIVIDTFDKDTPIINQLYDAETVTIRNLIKILREQYAADIELLGLTDWLKELEIRNETFDSLAKDYNEELAKKNASRSKEVRQNTDEAYDHIIEALSGLIRLEGIGEYESFVDELNELVWHYNTRVAQHLGSLHAKKEKEKKAEEEDEKKANEEDEKKDDTKTDDTK
jgi:hypothetical protein